MKYRILGLTAAFVMLAVTILASSLSFGNPKNRVHQHLTGRQPEAGCTCDKKELCTHLPLVLIDTDGMEIPGRPDDLGNGGAADVGSLIEDKEMLSAKLSVMSDEGRNHHPSDIPDLKTEALIRIRGNSSRHFEKSSYLLRLTDEEGKYVEEEMMGMAPHYEWVLHGPFLDKTLIRNYMWYNISGEIMDYSPNVRFCEVILNGEYQGLYVMTETITNGNDCRINVKKPVKGSKATGYLLRLDRGNKEPIKNIETFTNYSYRNLNKFDIKYPRSGDLTQEMADAIAQDFSNFEKSLYSYDYDTDDYGYFHRLDPQSFADYFIINEFTANYDAGHLSTYIYRDIGERYKLAVWDFNSACDNYVESPIFYNSFQMQYNVWYFMLMKDERFVERIIDRYRQLRVTCLNQAYLSQYIDDTLDFLGPAIERNFSVWGKVTSDYASLIPEDRNPKSHEEAVALMKDFIRKRGAWMDKYIEVLRQYSHESKNKKFNH